MNRQPEPEKVSLRRRHICAKVKTPYRKKHGGGTWRRPDGEPSGARAPPKGRAKRRVPPTASPPLSAPGVHPVAPFFVHRFCAPAGAKRRAPPGAPFLKGHHTFALWNDTIALRLKKTGRAAFRRRRAQIGWRSKKRLCYALFCPSAFFVKHSANFLKNAKGHHKFICANDNITLPGRKSRPCTAYSF